MIHYHLGIQEDYKRPKENRSYDYSTVMERQRMRLYGDARLRTFDIDIEDVGDLENHPILVSEYRKKPNTVHVQDKFMNTVECDCHFFYFEQLNDCVHIQAVKRLFETEPDFRARFSRRRRESRLMTYDSVYKEVTFWGGWDKRLTESTGFSEESGHITDLTKFNTFCQQHPNWVSGQIKGWYSQRLLKSLQIQKDLEWIGTVDTQSLTSKTLYDYQVEGVDHLLRRGRCILADDMGLGKTIQTISAVEALATHKQIKAVLIVCPSSVKFEWKKEVECSTKNTTLILNNAKDLNRLIEEETDALYIISSFELLQRNIDTFELIKFDVLVVDEAQRIRNFESKIWAGIRKMKTEYFFMLSGTLVENKLQDLFAVMELIDPHILGPRWKFEATYFRTEDDRFAGYHNLSQLRALVAPYIMRRTKEEAGIELPPLIETTRYCAMNTAQSELEQHYRDSAVKLLAMCSNREMSFQEKAILNQYLLKARQACDAAELCKRDLENPVKRSKSPKLTEFANLVEELCTDSTQKVLVFSEWIEMLKFASVSLEDLGLKYVLLTGKVPVVKRQAIIEDFLASSDKRVLLSTDAGGVGLNLQAASNIIHLDLPWNPARLDQRNGRIHRIRQKQTCYVNYLVSETGIERGIESVLKTKRSIRSASLNEDSDIDEVSFESFTSALNAAEEDD